MSYLNSDKKNKDLKAAKIYSQHDNMAAPEVIAETVHKPEITIDAIVDFLHKNPPVDNSLSGLDQYQRKDQLVGMLRAVPLPEIYRAFGRNFVAWHVNNLPFSEVLRIPPKDIRDSGGLEMHELVRAVALAQRKAANYNAGPDTEYMLLLHDKMLEFAGHELAGLENDNLFAKYVKPENKMRNATKARYQIGKLRSINPEYAETDGPEKEWGARYQDGLIFEVYLDGKFGFGLHFDQILQGLAGFDFTDSKTLLIKQIQGIRPEYAEMRTPRRQVFGDSWALAPLDWEAFLVDYTTAWAVKQGIETLGIQSAENNMWVHASGGHKIEKEFAIRRYDRTAGRLGFTKGPDGNFYKPISSAITAKAS